jgi:hypothetical protein
MKINLKISSWASKNAALSIFFIVAFEFIRIFIGIKLGKVLFSAISSFELLIVCLLVFSLIFVLQGRYDRLYSHLSKKDRYGYLIKYNTTIFLSSFILSMTFGAHLNTIEHPSRSIQLSAFEHNTNSDSTAHAILKQALEKQQNTATKLEEKSTDTGRRVLYFLFFLLSLALTYFAVIFACGIACSGYGVVAVLVLLLAQGVLGSGIYFLLKIFRRGHIKKWKEMSHEQRKREKKRLWLSIGISAVAFWLFILLGNMLQ